MSNDSPGLVPQLPSLSQLNVSFAKALAAYKFEPRIPAGMFFRRRIGGLRDFVSLLVDVRDRQAFATCNLGIHCMVPESSDDRLLRSRQVLTRNIGYLMPNRHWHEWALGDCSADNVEIIVDSIVTYGLPWLNAIRSIDDVRCEIRRSEAGGHRIRRKVRRLQA